MNVPLYILAGGQSSRFGGDKALANIAGKPMIAHVADQWAALASDVTVVAERSGKYEPSGFRTISDGEPGLGPIGGLLAALEDCAARGAEWLVLAACDAVVLDVAMLEKLFAGISPDAEVVAMKGERWETLPALYRVSILPVVRAAIERRERALWRVIERVRHKIVDISGKEGIIAQVNTPEDLQTLLARLKVQGE